MPTTELIHELMSRVRWTTDRLQAHQRGRLDDLLRHAVARSPYYRRTLGCDVGPGTPLQELPRLTKAALMENFDDIVTDGSLRRDRLEQQLSGPAASGRVGDHRVFTTAGTTGQRGVFVYADGEFDVWVASQLRMLQLMGVSPAMRVAAVGAPSPVHLSRQMFAALDNGCRPSTAPDLSVVTPVPELVAALNEYRPDAIPTYASTAALLAEEQLAGRLRINPSVIGTGAEVLSPGMRARIHDAWGIAPHQAYLATEAPLLASTGTAQVGMHLWEDLTLAEVVDADGRPVEPGVPGHTVLITNLVNRTQPLIRYELSDSVTEMAGPDPSGMPFRRLSAVDGRSADLFVLPAKEGGSVTVHPALLHAPFTGFPEVVQYQIADDSAVLTARLVVRPGSVADTADRLRSALLRVLREAGAVPPPVTVLIVDAIDREPGHAAKYQLIKGPLSGAAR